MAWRKIIALSLLAGVAFAGCTVTTDDPSEDDDGGTGGRNTGGSSTGGAKSSGGATTGGAKSTGGASTGGSDDGGPDSGPVKCDPGAAGKNRCEVCIETKCCQEWLDCGDDVNCSYKSDSQPGELYCIQDCLFNQFQDSGVTDLQECAGICAEESSGVSEATSAFIACIRDVDGSDGGVLQNCSEPCFGTEL